MSRVRVRRARVWGLGEVRFPTAPTLKKYGMTETDFEAMWKSQGGLCAVCGKDLMSGMFNIDHAHVRGFKKMPPEERRRHVRGIVCWFDNRYTLMRGMTPARLRAAADYLESRMAVA